MPSIGSSMPRFGESKTQVGVIGHAGWERHLLLERAPDGQPPKARRALASAVRGGGSALLMGRALEALGCRAQARLRVGRDAAGMRLAAAATLQLPDCRASLAGRTPRFTSSWELDGRRAGLLIDLDADDDRALGKRLPEGAVVLIASIADPATVLSLVDQSAAAGRRTVVAPNQLAWESPEALDALLARADEVIVSRSELEAAGRSAAHATARLHVTDGAAGVEVHTRHGTRRQETVRTIDGAVLAAGDLYAAALAAALAREIHDPVRAALADLPGLMRAPPLWPARAPAPDTDGGDGPAQDPSSPH